ncbi:GGDEF domain-containing protein [Ideonella margarita]|uniref:diguanylate cyclase n=1 Tax=Ideonella margarita TaxID=2984191 RepID=A0ABU9C3U1_9BURK
MRLRSLFVGLQTLIGVLIAALLIQVLLVQWQQVTRSDEGLQSLRQFKLLLVSAEMASRERGPANGVLGDQVPADPGKQERLKQARARADAALAQVQQALTGQPKVSTPVRQAAAQLERARKAVDALAALPPAKRDAVALHAAVGEMFKVIDHLEPVALQLADLTVQAYPELADDITAARHAADLRELAGRLGSQFTPAITARRVFTPAERLDIERLRGRIDELGKLIELRTRFIETHATSIAAAQTMQADYFGDAARFIDEQVATGSRDGAFTVDTAQFAARYVPRMDAIVSLRNTLLADAEQSAVEKYEGARRQFALLAAGGLLTLLLLAGTVWLINSRVVSPLLSVTNVISALTRGEWPPVLNVGSGFHEVAELQRSTDVLRQMSLDRQQLEQERQQLIEQLRDQSNTDFLTGLPNRRGFYALAEHHLISRLRDPVPLALAMFDLDHFKQINDQHGHDTGDAVLQGVAEVCSKLCRRGDVVARYGGEEFLVLMRQCSLEDAREQAQRLRQGISGLAFTGTDGKPLRPVTASFGVTVLADDDTDVQAALARADAALYGAKRAGRDCVMTMVP